MIPWDRVVMCKDGEAIAADQVEAPEFNSRQEVLI